MINCRWFIYAANHLLNAATIVAATGVHEHLRGVAPEIGVANRLTAGGCLDGVQGEGRIERYPHRCRTSEPSQLLGSHLIHDRIPHKDVRSAVTEGRQERLGFTDFRHCKPACVGCVLEPREFEAFAGLGMRPHGDSMRGVPLDELAHASGGRGAFQSARVA